MRWIRDKAESVSVGISIPFLEKARLNVRNSLHVRYARLTALSDLSRSFGEMIRALLIASSDPELSSDTLEVNDLAILYFSFSYCEFQYTIIYSLSHLNLNFVIRSSYRDNFE